MSDLVILESKPVDLKLFGQKSRSRGGYQFVSVKDPKLILIRGVTPTGIVTIAHCIFTVRFKWYNPHLQSWPDAARQSDIFVSGKPAVDRRVYGPIAFWLQFDLKDVEDYSIEDPYMTKKTTLNVKGEPRALCKGPIKVEMQPFIPPLVYEEVETAKLRRTKVQGWYDCKTGKPPKFPK